MTWESTLKARPTKRERPRQPNLVLLFTPELGVVHAAPVPLQSRTTPIGRAVSAEGVALPHDPRVSRLHAELTRASGDVVLTDTSSTGTEVNGQRIAQRLLEDGDLLRMGDSFLLFRADLHEEDAAEIDGMRGDAESLRQVRRTLRQLSQVTLTVLLLGETGTGKELAARALHGLSGRSGAFVAVNCGAIAESLAESQLFGHMAGSFTGAKHNSPGFFRSAHGGSLFLDEVGELSFTMQAKLLRALEERTVMPVGSSTPLAFDTRVVAATNRVLIEEVDEGRFRADLYARLTEFTVELPPLRARREDVLTLLQHELGPSCCSLEPELAGALLSHTWPFNVRELCKVASQLKILGKGCTTFSLEMFEPHLRHTFPARLAAAEAPSALRERRDEPSPFAAPEPDGASCGRPPRELPIPDRAELEVMLHKWRGVVADIARASGRSRRQVYRWLEQYGLDAERYRAGL